MDRAIPNTSPDRSFWLWPAILLGAAIVIEIAAVRHGDVGLAVSGIGVAMLGAFAFLAPISLRSNVRTMLRPPERVDAKVAILGGLGAVLNIVGVAVRWLG